MQGITGAQGPAGPQGPAGQAGVVASGFNGGGAPNPVPTGSNQATDAVFLTGTATVTIAAGQKIFVTSTATLGANATPATNLILWVCTKTAAQTDPVVFGPASFGLQAAANTRNHYSLSAVIPNLPAGTYSVALCGYTQEPTSHWTNNEWGYTSALVFQ
jgi:hypothetical protein